ncbi:Pho80p cyclin [Sorochytrium milnesiophthora]
MSTAAAAPAAAAAPPPAMSPHQPLPSSAKVIVPDLFHECDSSYLLHMIADMLQTLIAHNDQIPLSSSNLSRFHSRAPPSISVHDYLRRVLKYASIDKPCLLAILIYIDRICERRRSFTISSLTVHRFVVAAITVAAKAICDSYCTNTHYARVGGISVQELNTLELEFLFLIDWNVAVTNAVVQGYYANLVRQHLVYVRCSSPSRMQVDAATEAFPSLSAPSSSSTPAEQQQQDRTAEPASGAGKTSTVPLPSPSSSPQPTATAVPDPP